MEDARKIKAYEEKVKRLTPGSRVARDCLRAFWVGGVICCLGQALTLLGGKNAADGDYRAHVHLRGADFPGHHADGHRRIRPHRQIRRAPGLSCPSRALPIPWPRRPSNSGAEGLVLGVGAKLFQPSPGRC